jgi:hypothetical protein
MKEEEGPSALPAIMSYRFNCTLSNPDVYFSRIIRASSAERAAALFKLDIAGTGLPRADISVIQADGRKGTPRLCWRFTWGLDLVSEKRY